MSTLSLSTIEQRLSQLSPNDTHALRYWQSLRDKYLRQHHCGGHGNTASLMHAESSTVVDNNVTEHNGASNSEDLNLKRGRSHDSVEKRKMETMQWEEMEQDDVSSMLDESDSNTPSSDNEQEVDECLRLANDEDTPSSPFTDADPTLSSVCHSLSQHAPQRPVPQPVNRKRKSLGGGSELEWRNLESNVYKRSSLDDFQDNQEQFRRHLCRRKRQVDNMKIPDDNISKAIMSRLQTGDVSPDELSSLMQQMQQQENDLSQSQYNIDEEESTISSEDEIDRDLKTLEDEIKNESSSQQDTNSTHSKTPTEESRSFRDICCLAPDTKQDMCILQYMDHFDRMTKGFLSLKRVFATFVWTPGKGNTPARATANDPVKHQQKYNDKMVTQFESGKVVIEKFASKTRKTIMPNGHIVTRFSNGDMRRVILGKRVEKYLHNSRLYHVLNVEDKTEVFYHLASRRCKMKFPNGVNLLLSSATASGSNQCRIYTDNDRKETLFANGTRQVHHMREGLKEILLPSGQYFVKMVPPIDAENMPSALDRYMQAERENADSNSDDSSDSGSSSLSS